MGKCLMYIDQPSHGWYEAMVALPTEPSSPVRAFKTLRFPPNQKGEVTEEDFELLKRHGHIGEGRLQVMENLGTGKRNLA